MLIRVTWKQYTGDDKHFHRQSECPGYLEAEGAEDFFSYMSDTEALTADAKTKIRVALWIQDHTRKVISIRLHSSTGYHQMELRKHKGVIFHKMTTLYNVLTECRKCRGKTKTR
jgi:hypothetical protein